LPVPAVRANLFESAGAAVLRVAFSRAYELRRDNVFFGKRLFSMGAEIYREGMRKRCHGILIVLLACAASGSERLWSDPYGNTVRAELVEVRPDETVVLKSDGQLTPPLPFSRFSRFDRRLLHNRLAALQGGVSDFNAVNAALGVPLFRDPFLWDDDAGETAARLELDPEGRTDYMGSFRRYFPDSGANPKRTLLDEPVRSLAVYAQNGGLCSFTALFIEPDLEALRRRLAAALGEPQAQRLGDKRARERVLRWDAGEHVFLLNDDGNPVVPFRILPKDQADWSDKQQALSATEKKERADELRQRVVRDEFGDTVINGIPMINQGPLGYCVPATWERYLWYMGVSADMYIIGAAAGTARQSDGGTYLDELLGGIGRILYVAGCKLREVKTRMSLVKIRYYLDQGLPVMWTLSSTPEFNEAVNRWTEKRRRTDREAWPSVCEVERKYVRKGTIPFSHGHMCLITGYNETTGELRISDSWGAEFEERWLLIEEAMRVAGDRFYVISW